MNYSRNIGILTEDEQERICCTKIAILGLGMGSNISELAVRSGFNDILLVDGDLVTETNLNRQAFTANDIGKDKVRSIAERLRLINPNVKINLLPEYLGKDFSSLEGYDLIIDTIDLSSVDVIVALHDWARKKGKQIIFPFNLGWRSIVTVFNDNSCTFGEMLGLTERDIDKAKAKDFSFWVKFLSKYVPPYGQTQFEEFVATARTMNDWCPAPQLGITVATTASVTITLAILIALGRSTILAPNVASIDLFDSAIAK